MSTRFIVHKPLTKKRLRNFVALDNLTAQTPLIEIIEARRNRRVRIWVAYDPERICGTYTEVFYDGMVQTSTVYPSGNTRTITNRPGKRRPPEKMNNTGIHHKQG
jgi:hypothetical protein